MNLKIIFGPPNSGKSWKIENDLEKIQGKALYFGTLNIDLINADYIIDRHKVRRNESKWILYEITNNYNTDFNSLTNIILSENPHTLLIDGVWNLFKSYGLYWSDLNIILEFLIQFITSNLHNLNIIIIDSSYKEDEIKFKRYAQSRLNDILNKNN